jgi:hypothetical protein
VSVPRLTNYLRRWTLPVIAAWSIVWAVAISVSGGILLQTSWGRISSRNPIRPFLLAGLALVVHVIVFRRHVEEDVPRLQLVRPTVVAGLLVAAALLIGIGYGTFAASAADASGYVSQAEMWLRGVLTTPAPEWARDAPWQDAGWSPVPLGYRPSEISHAFVPTYSPGLPIAMALFQAIGGRNAVYYVVPIFGALTIWITYVLGARFAGPWAGVLSTLLMLTSPTFLRMLVQPMSDVPAAALWGIALWAAWRGGTMSSAGAGVAAAFAIVTRPNIAPLAGVVALVVVARPAARVRDLLWFGAALVPAAVAIALLNAHLYGSPLRSGYGPLNVLYSVDRVWPNLVLYTGWLLDTQTPLILLAFAAPLVIPGKRADRRLITLTGVLFPVVLLALYLPYFVFETWTFLRFLLPAYPPLLGATAAVIVTLLRRTRHQPPAIAMTALVVTGLAIHGIHYSGAFMLETSERRYTRVAEYVMQLPSRAVFVTLLHSGSIRYYTGRDILRWDLIDPASFDTAVDYIRARGHDVYAVVDDVEESDFARRLSSTRAVRELDREPPVDLGGVRVFAIGGSQHVQQP